MYDALILGGGPAGLSAAVYLARFMRSVLVLDAGEGRSSFSQVNENYLGFPEGISTLELRERGTAQAQRFGAEIRECRIERVEAIEGGYRAFTTDGDFEGRTVLFATGVTDIWAALAGIHPWIGRCVFWCITCDGYQARGKRLVCIGNTDEAAVTTLQMLLYTRDITLVTDPEHDRVSPEKCADLEAHGIPIVHARLDCMDVAPDESCITGIRLEGGEILECDLIFSLLGVRPNTQMARELGVAVDPQGYIHIDEEGYTNLPGVFAAGDLTGMYTQQIASAVHAGAEAAQTMNYYLYADYQKNPQDI